MNKKTMRIIIYTSMISILLLTIVFAGGSKKNIEVLINSVNLTVNGNKVNAETILYNGTTYVPLRTTAEMLDKEVGWDQKTNTASINDKTTELQTSTSTPNNDESSTLNSTPILIPTQASSDEVNIELTYETQLEYNNSVGNEWSSWIYIDGAANFNKTIDLCIKDTQVLNLEVVMCESDDSKSDFGWQEINIPIHTLKNGLNTFELDIIVSENGGRYKDNTAKWKVKLFITKNKEG